MDTQIKIKSEIINPEYDEIRKVLPMPIIVPKIEPTNENLTSIFSLARLKPKHKENVKKNDKFPIEIRLPIPFIKQEKSDKKFDTTLIDEVLSELDDPLFDELQIIQNDMTNGVLYQTISNTEGEREQFVSDYDTDTEIIKRKIQEHKEKIKKHKKRKVSEELNRNDTNQFVNVKNEKKSIRRSRKTSNSDEDNNTVVNSYRQSSNKKKKSKKRKSKSPSSNAFTKKALVRDYNLKPILPKDDSISNVSNDKNYPMPIIVKVEAGKLLPTPIFQLEKNIKIEKTDLPKTVKKVIRMDTQIKIKTEIINPEYDEIQKVLPMPIIEPKIEPANDNSTTFLAPNQSETIKIKLEPKDKDENVKKNDKLPYIKQEKSDKISSIDFDITSINEVLAELGDPLFDELQDIQNDMTNGVLDQTESNIEIVDESKKSASNDDDTDTEIIKRKILEHKEKIKKHKKRKVSEELNRNDTNQFVNVKNEKKSAKRSRKTSNSDEYNSTEENSYRQSNKKKKSKKRKSKSPSSNAFTKIPLVRDYNHKPIYPKDDSISNVHNVKKLPRPIIVKVEADKVLPKPIHQLEKNIKIEKPDLPKNSPMTVKRVLKRCSKIISNLETYEKNNFSTKMLYTPINFVTPSNSNTENRSPILGFKNVHYNISSTAKINYKELGMIAPPEVVCKLARIMGFETSKLIDLIIAKASSSDFKLNNDVNKSILTNINSFSSFYTNVSTQTDQIPCDQCVLRKLRKRHDISVQAVANMNDIGSQTEKEDELPMIKQFHTLNMNQQLALNDFYSLIIGGQPTSANDKLKLRDSLMHIFDMSTSNITTQHVINPVSLIPPPPPVLPPNPYNSGITQSVIGYQPPIMPTSQRHYDYYLQSQQLMVPNNYPQPQPQARHLHQMPRNNDPRRHNR